MIAMGNPIVPQPILGALKWLLMAILPLDVLKTYWTTRNLGELRVSLFAHWQLDRRTFRSLHDFTLT